MMLRDKRLDSIKGLLIILVVFFHVTYVGQYYGLFYELKEYVYMFHMPVFLFITGYFLSFERESFISVLFVKLIIPYFVFYGFYLFVLFFLGRYTYFSTSNNLTNLNDFALFMFFQPIASYWYLHSLIIFSLVFFVSRKLVVKKITDKRYCYFFQFILSAGFIFLLKNIGFEFYWWVFLCLIVGVFCRLYNPSLEFNWSVGFVAGLMIMFFLYFSITPFLNVLVSVFVFYFLLFIFSKLNVNVLSFIGRNTLVIFLFHVYPVNFLKLFQGFFVEIESSGLFYAITSCLVSLSLSLLIGKIFDWFHFSRFFFGVVNVIK